MPVASSLQAAESHIQMKSWLTVIVVIITIATILKTPSDQTLCTHFFLYHSNHPGVPPFYRWEPSNPYWLSDSSTVSRNTHSCRRMSQSLNRLSHPKACALLLLPMKVFFPNRNTRTWAQDERAPDSLGHLSILWEGTRTACIKLCRLQRHSQIFLCLKWP